MLALAALSGLLATCCLAQLWCLIMATPGAMDHQRRLDSNAKQQQKHQQQQQERQQISVYDEQYLPALERLPAAMSQCIATRAQLPSTADLAAACVPARRSTPRSVMAGSADAITAWQHCAARGHRCCLLHRSESRICILPAKQHQGQHVKGPHVLCSSICSSRQDRRIRLPCVISWIHAQCRRRRYATLPRLAIVMSCTADHVDNEQLARAHNLESWAIRHGYAFHYNVMNPDDYAGEVGLGSQGLDCKVRAAMVSQRSVQWTCCAVGHVSRSSKVKLCACSLCYLVPRSDSP